MEYKAEYWILERATLDRAAKLGLDDPSIWRSKLAKRDAAIKKFNEVFPLILEERPMPEVNWRSHDLNSKIDTIFERYFTAFSEKLALGECYSKLHEGVGIHQNLGYQIGDTLVDIATHDAVSKLSGASYMDYRDDKARVHYVTDKEGVAILGRVISATLAALKVLEPQEEESLDGWPKLLRIRPEPRTLRSTTTKEELLELIDTQVWKGAMTWADDRQKQLFETQQWLSEMGKEPPATAMSL